MKVLYVITKSNWGGAQRNVFDLAVAMKEKGNEVYVALGGEGPLRTKLEAAGIYTHSISSLGRDVSLGKDFASFKEIYSVIKYRRPDVLHLHSPKAAGLGALAGRLLRTKLIVQTIHGWTFNESRPVHQTVGIAIFSWITLLLTHKTITLSEKEYDQGRQFAGSKDKLCLIPLGIKPHVLMSIDGAKLMMSKKIGIDISKRTTLVTVAELHPNKGLTYLVRALEIVVKTNPNILSVIIGDGQDKAALTMLIKEKGLENNIILAGYVENASEYLKAFSMMVLPSLKEGLPYVILEAGSSSLPVVATTVGGIPEVVEDMKSGILVQSKNYKELAHAINFMTEHPIERKKYGANLRERILTNFSMEKMIEKAFQLYQSSLK